MGRDFYYVLTKKLIDIISRGFTFKITIENISTMLRQGIEKLSYITYKKLLTLISIAGLHGYAHALSERDHYTREDVVALVVTTEPHIAAQRSDRTSRSRLGPRPRSPTLCDMLRELA